MEKFLIDNKDNKRLILLLDCHFLLRERCLSKTDDNDDDDDERKDIVNSTIEIKQKSMQPSISPSSDLSWLDPLPGLNCQREERIFLPQFKDFEYVGRLGNGGSAQVYCVQHILSKQYFAIKVADGEDEQARLQLEVEKQILFRYSYGNPYMIKAYCAFHHGSKLFLVMELVQGGTLCHKIQTIRMNEDDIRFYLAQIISVLQYLHSKHIVYRDLKLEHAIVSSTGSLRLIDYGLGRLLQSSDEMCHTFCGTYSYMAPEVRCLEKSTSKEGYSYAVDFWALGIMFVQMLWGEKVDFCTQMFQDDEYAIYPSEHRPLPLPPHASAEARSCISGLLEIDPKKRLGSSTSPHGLIREHPFFKIRSQVNWEHVETDSLKPMHKVSSIVKEISEESSHHSINIFNIDTGGKGRADWLAVGKSTCTLTEEEQYKSFDYINKNSLLDFDQSEVF